jgi:hypothetical protein
MHVRTLELLGSASRGDLGTVQQLLDSGVPWYQPAQEASQRYTQHACQDR